jgi:signal transduction histidine kinase
MLDLLYHTFNYTIAACYFVIFLLIFVGLLREKAFGRNALGTATSGIFFTCALGHVTHAVTSHAMGDVWQAGLQVIVDGWTVVPAVTYLILRRRFGLIVRGPDLIQEYQTQIAEQKRELKALRDYEELKNNFMAMASHELRTPLTSIKGYAQVLQKRLDTTNDRKVTTAVNTIYHQTERMSSLIDNLLDVTKIQSNQLELKPTAVNLVATIRDVITSLQITTTSHAINFSAPTDEIYVKFDSIRLEQVITNLTTNAVKYSPESQKIDLRANIVENAAILEVQDYGIGIQPAELTKIFDRFYRSKTTNGKEGLGLGLYISNEIIKASDGELTVSSNPGAGSVFTVKLPLYAETLENPATYSPLPETSLSKSSGVSTSS